MMVGRFSTEIALGNQNEFSLVERTRGAGWEELGCSLYDEPLEHGPQHPLIARLFFSVSL